MTISSGCVAWRDVGPSLSGYLSHISLTTPIWAALVLSIASILVTAIWVRGAHAQGQVSGDRAVDEAVKDKVSFRSLVTSPVIRVLVILFLFHYFSYGMFSSQLAVFLGDSFTWNGHAFGPRELGYILTADGAINILVQLFLLKWIGRYFTERGLIVFVFSILSIGYITAGLAAGIPMLAFAVLCVSTGVALARPTFMAALSVHVPQQRQGVVMGTAQALVAVTDIVSPVLAGFILGFGLYGTWISTVVAIAMTGAVIARGCLPRVDPETVGAKG